MKRDKIILYLDKPSRKCFFVYDENKVVNKKLSKDDVEIVTNGLKTDGLKESFREEWDLFEVVEMKEKTKSLNECVVTCELRFKLKLRKTQTEKETK
jgi:hypothetical protein